MATVSGGNYFPYSINEKPGLLYNFVTLRKKTQQVVTGSKMQNHVPSSTQRQTRKSVLFLLTGFNAEIEKISIESLIYSKHVYSLDYFLTNCSSFQLVCKPLQFYVRDISSSILTLLIALAQSQEVQGTGENNSFMPQRSESASQLLCLPLIHHWTSSISPMPSL